MKTKHRFALLGSLLLSITLQDAAGSPAGDDPASVPAPLKRMIEQAKKIRSLSADITETRQLRTLSRPLVSKGRLLFVAPSSFRWENGPSGETVLIGNAGEMFLIRRGKGEARSCTRVSGDTTPSQWPLGIPGLFPWDHDALLRSFRVESIAIRSGVCHAEMTPLDGGPLRGVSSLHLDFNAEDGRWIRLRIITREGSSLLEEFSNVRINPVIPEHLFRTDSLTAGKSTP